MRCARRVRISDWRDVGDRQLLAERGRRGAERGDAGDDLALEAELAARAELLVERAVERRVAGVHARDAEALGGRAAVDREHVVEGLVVGGDELGARPRVRQHLGVDQRARPHDDVRLAEHARGAQRQQVGRARARADEPHAPAHRSPPACAPRGRGPAAPRPAPRTIRT